MSSAPPRLGPSSISSNIFKKVQIWHRLKLMTEMKSRDTQRAVISLHQKQAIASINLMFMDKCRMSFAFKSTCRVNTWSPLILTRISTQSLRELLMNAPHSQLILKRMPILETLGLKLENTHTKNSHSISHGKPMERNGRYGSREILQLDACFSFLLLLANVSTFALC